jgi:hypothetical protein
MRRKEQIQPEAMCVEDALRFIGIGRTKFYELVKEKRIVPRKIGRRTLVLRNDLLNMLDSLPSEAA